MVPPDAQPPAPLEATYQVLALLWATPVASCCCCGPLKARRSCWMGAMASSGRRRCVAVLAHAASTNAAGSQAPAGDAGCAPACQPTTCFGAHPGLRATKACCGCPPASWCCPGRLPVLPTYPVHRGGPTRSGEQRSGEQRCARVSSAACGGPAPADPAPDPGGAGGDGPALVHGAPRQAGPLGCAHSTGGVHARALSRAPHWQQGPCPGLVSAAGTRAGQSAAGAAVWQLDRWASGTHRLALVVAP